MTAPYYEGERVECYVGKEWFPATAVGMSGARDADGNYQAVLMAILDQLPHTTLNFRLDRVRHKEQVEIPEVDKVLSLHPPYPPDFLMDLLMAVKKVCWKHGYQVSVRDNEVVLRRREYDDEGRAGTQDP